MHRIQAILFLNNKKRFPKGKKKEKGKIASSQLHLCLFFVLDG
uniref:Uncharacterized protein n=1 Tax=Rhizophora mucronata TaxID=61149 RepID=A0A2P2P8K9_RHIMU